MGLVTALTDRLLLLLSILKNVLRKTMLWKLTVGYVVLKPNKALRLPFPS